jgi:ribosome-associated protein
MKLDTPYIKLDSFMKAVDAASSGGEAKFLITEGKVFVNGETELRRGRKLYPGDLVQVAEKRFLVE